MKTHRILLAMLLAAGAAGCGDGRPVDTGKLATPTDEQNAAIEAFDRSVSDEEFRRPEPGSKPSRVAARKRPAGSQ
jgi:hypothetical protein